MGVSFRATVFFGSALNGKDLHTKKVVKTFEHDYPADWYVDPKTGRALWREISEPIEGYDEDYFKLFGYEVRHVNGDPYVCLSSISARPEWGQSPIVFGPPSQEEIDQFMEKLRDFVEDEPRFHLTSTYC